MRRWDFITLVCGVAGAWPLASVAQQPAMPVIGFLSSISPDDRQAPMTRGYLQGLAETGFVEGRNVTIEYRWASGHYDQLPAMVADLISRRVSVIDAVAGSAPGLAAKAATTTIPIVFQTGSDPVRDGLVSSINRPTGNITGVTRLGTTVEPGDWNFCMNWCPAHRQFPCSSILQIRPPTTSSKRYKTRRNHWALISM
jgi:putative tryptophan/tyrosine transport system substrate-binding protein